MRVSCREVSGAFSVEQHLKNTRCPICPLSKYVKGLKWIEGESGQASIFVLRYCSSLGVFELCHGFLVLLSPTGRTNASEDMNQRCNKHANDHVSVSHQAIPVSQSQTQRTTDNCCYQDLQLIGGHDDFLLENSRCTDYTGVATRKALIKSPCEIAFQRA